MADLEQVYDKTCEAYRQGSDREIKDLKYDKEQQASLNIEFKLAILRLTMLVENCIKDTKEVSKKTRLDKILSIGTITLLLIGCILIMTMTIGYQNTLEVLEEVKRLIP